MSPEARLSPYERAVNRLNDLPRGLDRIFTEALEDMRAQRDTARAEGVAAERARVVADLRAEVKALREMKFCACGCEMPLAEALKERKNGYLNDEQAESLMPVRIGGARTNAEAARLERAADRIERGEHDREGT